VPYTHLRLEDGGIHPAWHSKHEDPLNIIYKTSSYLAGNIPQFLVHVNAAPVSRSHTAVLSLKCKKERGRKRERESGRQYSGRVSESGKPWEKWETFFRGSEK
jgi:hypothetical protein